MRASVNFSKSAMQFVPADAGRVRVKRDADGALMFLPTSRKVISNLPKDEVARKLTRLQSGIATAAVNYEDIVEGVYILQPSKFNWLKLVPVADGTLPALSVARVRVSRKS